MIYRAVRAAAFVTGLFVMFASVPGHAQSFGDLVRSTQDKPTGSFGSMAIAVKAQSLTTVAPEWRSVTARMNAERAALDRCIADSSRCATAQQRDWAAMIRGARGLDRAAQLAAVNAFFNRFSYRTDSENYGRSEYWATLTEFLANSGDCEDYAIAKFYTLRELGFRGDQMKVVIVTDTARGVGHAVVTAQLNGASYVLDNLSREVLPEARITHYTALASMNESGIWVDVPSMHRKPGWERMASLQ